MKEDASSLTQKEKRGGVVSINEADSIQNPDHPTKDRIVSDYLRSLIYHQVKSHSLVVWYDPEGHYLDFQKSLELPETAVVSFQGSFFALRYQIDHLLNDDEPPRLLIYLPLDRSDTYNALVEAEAAGVVMQPGQHPNERNTRLSIIARNALKKSLGEEAAADIEKQVASGKLSFSELDGIGDRVGQKIAGVIPLIFQTTNPKDVDFKFLSSDRYDERIIEKDALSELTLMMQGEFGLQAQVQVQVQVQTGSPEEVRQKLARHILVTEFLSSLKSGVPAQLAAMSIASNPGAADACRSFAREWRQRRDLKESYVKHAVRIESEIFCQPLKFSIQDLDGLETFSCTDSMLQVQIEKALAENASPEILEMSRQRQSGFWSGIYPQIQMQWAFISVLAQLLLEADRVERELTRAGSDLETILRAYAGGEAPWCLLDTYYRWMERRYQKLCDVNEELEWLVNRSRDRYMAVGSNLATAFQKSFEAFGFRAGGLPRQYEIFDKYVRPSLAEGKTAYFLVDALRFEMARDLIESLSDEYETTLTPVLACVPTITEIGMAALLPGANEGTVIGAGESKLAVKIGDFILKNRSDRMEFLKSSLNSTRLNSRIFVTWMDDLLPTPKKHIRNAIENSDLIIVTSREIDNLCEKGEISLARRAMDEVLDELRQAFKAMASNGVKTIIVAADHGYLFGDKISDNMVIKPPGGDEADLHRRVWIGRGGSRDDSFMRARVSEFGLKSDLELATPWGFACFAVSGGSGSYFHGGLSPQEVIIPLVTLKPQFIEKQAYPVVWSIAPGSQKISTSYFSLTISGRSSSLTSPEALKVKVVIKAKAIDEVISKPISASYDFEEATGEVRLKPSESDPLSYEKNTVTLEIYPTTEKTASIQLMDATTGVLLLSKDIVVSLLQY